MPFAEVKPAHCIFELIYFARPDSQIFGQNVYLCRKRLGHSLAREYRPDVDFVMPFPDSGNYAALGYAEESGLPFEMGMIRNHYVGRTFIQPSQAMRDFGVRVKLNPVQPLIDGQEDRDRRGFDHPGDDQPEPGPAPAGERREGDPHGRELPADAPPLPLRDRFFVKGELIAAEKEDEAEIASFIGLDSLHYLSIEGMVEATGMPRENFCLACYTGDYPLPAPEELREVLLRGADVLRQTIILQQTFVEN